MFGVKCGREPGHVRTTSAVSVSNMSAKPCGCQWTRLVRGLLRWPFCGRRLEKVMPQQHAADRQSNSSDFVATADAARSRLMAKLDYARVHLEELDAHKGHGDPFDRAHEESFLFHLDGCVDAFLQEVNVVHELGLPLRGVSLATVKNSLREDGVRCASLHRLRKLLSKKGCWLRDEREFRNHVTHRAALVRTFYVGHPEKHGHVELRNPSTDELMDKDKRQLFREWLNEASALYGSLSDDLRAERGLRSTEAEGTGGDRSGGVSASVHVSDTFTPRAN